MIRTFSITQTSEGASDSTWFFLMPSIWAPLSCTARVVAAAMGITHGITKGIVKGCARGIARRAPIKESPYKKACCNRPGGGRTFELVQTLCCRRFGCSIAYCLASELKR